MSIYSSRSTNFKQCKYFFFDIFQSNFFKLKPSSTPSLFMHSAFNFGVNGGHSNLHSLHRTNAFNVQQQNNDYFDTSLVCLFFKIIFLVKILK